MVKRSGSVSRFVLMIRSICYPYHGGNRGLAIGPIAVVMKWIINRHMQVVMHSAKELPCQSDWGISLILQCRASETAGAPAPPLREKLDCTLSWSIALSLRVKEEAKPTPLCIFLPFRSSYSTYFVTCNLKMPYRQDMRSPWGRRLLLPFLIGISVASDEVGRMFSTCSRHFHRH